MTKDLVGTVWDSKDGKRAIVIARHCHSRIRRQPLLSVHGLGRQGLSMYRVIGTVPQVHPT
ncbi:hypothetical protein PROPHIGD43A-4_42 [Mycobacterium phage prophiGD43A-4]|nr:hypothetical protein PROPHIGD43A-4_42 [Mycobacterium phage prophiGD43A-4]